MIDLFTDENYPRLVKEFSDFGEKYCVYVNGKVVYSSPFYQLALNFLEEFKSLAQL